MTGSTKVAPARSRGGRDPIDEAGKAGPASREAMQPGSLERPRVAGLMDLDPWRGGGQPGDQGAPAPSVIVGDRSFDRFIAIKQGRSIA